MEKGQLTQANRYITWVRQNPDSFELLARKNIKGLKGEIDFSNPRILCFAQGYSIDDKCLALSLGAELWKYIYYENDTLVISKEEEPEQLIKGKGTTNFTIKKIKKENRTKKTVNEHLQGASKDIADTFQQFNDMVLDISSEIEQYTTAAEILYKTSVNFAALSVQKKNKKIRILLRTVDDQMDDPKKLTKKVPKSHGWGNLTRILDIDPKLVSKEYTWDDIMELVIQSYNSTQ